MIYSEHPLHAAVLSVLREYFTLDGPRNTGTGSTWLDKAMLGHEGVHVGLGNISHQHFPSLQITSKLIEMAWTPQHNALMGRSKSCILQPIFPCLPTDNGLRFLTLFFAHQKMCCSAVVLKQGCACLWMGAVRYTSDCRACFMQQQGLQGNS